MKMLEAHPIWRLFRKYENNDGGRAIFNYQNIYMKKNVLLPSQYVWRMVGISDGRVSVRVKKQRGEEARFLPLLII